MARQLIFLLKGLPAHRVSRASQRDTFCFMVVQQHTEQPNHNESSNTKAGHERNDSSGRECEISDKITRFNILKRQNVITSAAGNLPWKRLAIPQKLYPFAGPAWTCDTSHRVSSQCIKIPLLALAPQRVQSGCTHHVAQDEHSSIISFISHRLLCDLSCIQVWFPLGCVVSQKIGNIC
eukprot:2879810-Amphidinium_carterae.1